MKYLITGGSGYIGSRLTDLLVERDDTEVVNVDIRPPAVPRSRTRFIKMDIRDRGMRELFERERPDAVVHLAFVLNPIRDEHTMYDIDVNGTQNVLEAASAAGVAAAARRVEHDRLRRVPRQPGADGGGAPGARPARLRVRARQDGDRPPVPAVGGAAPGPRDDDRAAHDRVRAERRQLHRAVLADEPVLPAARRQRPRLAVRARGGRRVRDLAAARRARARASSTSPPTARSSSPRRPGSPG